MQEITFMEAVELTAFGGRKDILAFMSMGEVSKLTLGDLRNCADQGGRFFVLDEPDAKPMTQAEADPIAAGMEDAATDLTAADVSYKGKAVKQAARIIRKQPVKPARQTAPLDHGKICALYRANWSVEKIADEMNCHVSSVYNHLNKEGLIKK